MCIHQCIATRLIRADIDFDRITKISGADITCQHRIPGYQQLTVNPGQLQTPDVGSGLCLVEIYGDFDQLFTKTVTQGYAKIDFSFNFTSQIMQIADDTAIFFTIAFSAWLAVLEPASDVGWANEALPLLGAGPVVPLWVSLAIADWGVKLAIALAALVPFRLIVKRMTVTLA